jgi:hypothetical protein
LATCDTAFIAASFVSFSSLLWSFTARAQSEENARQRVGNEGLISLNPYIPESENIDESTYSAMITKLNQIVTAYGMSGTGFDNRFIITAHLQNVKSTVPCVVSYEEYCKGSYGQLTIGQDK